MPEVLVLNPRRRRNRLGRFVKGARRVNARKRRRRNPIAALAANPRRRRRRHRNPIALAANPRRRKSRRRNPIALAANPRRRRRRNPRASRRRYRRNPSAMGSIKSMLSVRGLTNTLMPAAIGGAGALGVDILLTYIPTASLPEFFNTTAGKFALRVIGAIGLGALAGMVVPRRTAGLITAGALTVTAYGAIKDVVAQNFPQLQGVGPNADYSDLNLGYISPAPRLGAYMQRSIPRSNGVGAYMRDGLDNVNSLSGVTSDGM